MYYSHVADRSLLHVVYVLVIRWWVDGISVLPLGWLWLFAYDDEALSLPIMLAL